MGPPSLLDSLARMTHFAWEPSPEYIERANVSRLMRKHGIDDYRALVTRSIDDIEWFWSAAIEDLGIDFFDPYDRILDVTEGPQFPRCHAPCHPAETAGRSEATLSGSR